MPQKNIKKASSQTVKKDKANSKSKNGPKSKKEVNSATASVKPRYFVDKNTSSSESGISSPKNPTKVDATLPAKDKIVKKKKSETDMMMLLPSDEDESEPDFNEKDVEMEEDEDDEELSELDDDELFELENEILAKLGSNDDEEEDSKADTPSPPVGTKRKHNVETPPVSLPVKTLKKSKVEAENNEDEDIIKEIDGKLTKKEKKARSNKSEPSNRGVVYLSRIPHGFYEKEMHAYFTQFGEVTRLRLCRNRQVSYCFFGLENVL